MKLKPLFYILGGVMLLITGAKIGEFYTVKDFNKKMENYEKTNDPYLKSIISSWRILDNNFTNKISNTKKAEIRDSMLNSMLSSVDPHAVWWNRENISKLNNHINGKYLGIGITFEKDLKGLKITSVLKDSPADKKGLKSGQYIISVNKKNVEKQYLEVIKIIKNDEDINLELNIDGKEILITKEAISNFNVISSIEDFGNNGKWLRLQINEFQLTTVDEIVKQIRESWYPLSKENKNGIILDLRGSPGGVVDVAAGLASLFMSQNKDIVSLYLNRPKETIPYKTVLYPREGFSKWVKEAPLIIWCDDFSASAAEILISGLKEQGRTAWVIGEKTYGKGTIQKTFTVNDYGAMTFTVGFYKTVNREYLQWEGIQPDVIIKYPEILRKQIDKNKERFLVNSLTPPNEKKNNGNIIYMDLPKDMKLNSVELYNKITIDTLNLAKSYSDYLMRFHEK